MSNKFTPISSASPYLAKQSDYELSCEKRLRSRHAMLYDRIKSRQSSIIHRLGDSLGELRSFYRFLNNPNVEMSDLINKHCQIASNLLEGRHVLCLGDGLSINMGSAHGRMTEAEQTNLGVLENNQTPGMLSQVILAIDAESEEVLGLGDIVLYNRAKREGKVDKHGARKRSYEDKESSKWSLSARNAKVHLAGCSRLTYVFDRDADRFEVLQDLAQIAQTDFIIRVKENRMVDHQGHRERLNVLFADQPLQGQYELEIKALDHWIREGRAKKRRKARRSNMELRWLALDQIDIPTGFRSSKALTPITRPTYCIEAKESELDVPVGETPIHWRLLTSHPVHTKEQAQRIISYYQRRWHIEQLFRLCKKKGLELEATQLESVAALKRLTIMTIAAACQLMQLNLARQKASPGSIHFAFDELEIELLDQLNSKYQGKTQAQQNPFPKDRLSWAWWIMGRLGGWKGYFSQGPPGPISISRGFFEFQIYKRAWSLFNNSRVVYKE